MDEPTESDWDDDLPEDHAYFEGPCTCEHPEEQHDWGRCGVGDCPCEAGWTE